MKFVFPKKDKELLEEKSWQTKEIQNDMKRTSRLKFNIWYRNVVMDWYNLTERPIFHVWEHIANNSKLHRRNFVYLFIFVSDDCLCNKSKLCKTYPIVFCPLFFREIFLMQFLILIWRTSDFAIPSTWLIAIFNKFSKIWWLIQFFKWSSIYLWILILKY